LRARPKKRIAAIVDNGNPFWLDIKESNQVPFGVLRYCNDIICPLEHISELSLVIPSVVQSLEMGEFLLYRL
jgi:hypothetical protein